MDEKDHHPELAILASEFSQDLTVMLHGHCVMTNNWHETRSFCSGEQSSAYLEICFTTPRLVEAKIEI